MKTKPDSSIGLHGQAEVYEILDGSGWKVEPAQDSFLQSRGIDAFISKSTLFHSVQVKTDMRAMQTGEAFLELVVARPNRPVEPGWLYKTCAQVVLYYVPSRGLYAFDVHALRDVVNRVGKRGGNQQVVKYPEDNREVIGASFYLSALVSECSLWSHEWK